MFEKFTLLENKEAHKKVLREFPYGVRDASEWRQQNFICIRRGDGHQGAKCAVAHLISDHIFENVVAGAAFRKLIKKGGVSTGERSISVLTRLDAVMTIAVDSPAVGVTSSKTGNKNAAQEEDVQMSDLLLSRTNKRRAVPQESLRKLKLMLLMAASNLFSFCSKRYLEFWGSASENALSELATKWVGSIGERIKHSSHELIVCSKMPDTGHYYISVTVHASSEFICVWIGKVSDC